MMNTKKIIITISSLLIIAVIVFFVIQSDFFYQEDKEGVITPSVERRIEKLPSKEAGLLIEPGLDSDGDGLYDEFEIKQGSNPNKKDTDNDGLNDFEELRFRTDYSNPDTDNDGYLDGVEVEQGFDPIRPQRRGLLF